MAYEVPESGRGNPDNRFEFVIGDETYSIPTMEYLTGEQAAILRRIRIDGGMDFDSMSATWELLGSESEDVRDAVMALDIHQVSGLLQAWVEASKVSPGESVPSKN